MTGYHYAILSYATDVFRDISVPVGVVLCRANGGEPYIKCATEAEAVAGVDMVEAGPFIRKTARRISYWICSGKLPYGGDELQLFSPTWWRHMRGLLQFRVRLSEMRAIDVSDLITDGDALYEEIVQPELRVSAPTVRRKGGQCASNPRARGHGGGCYMSKMGWVLLPLLCIAFVVYVFMAFWQSGRLPF